MMGRQSSSLVLVMVAAACWLATVANAGPQLSAPAKPEAFAVRRLLVDPARVPEILANHDSLLSVPRARFERSLARANERALALRSPPRVLEAHYEAFLDEERLAGRSAWKVHNPHAEEMVLPLAPWNLALKPGATLDNRPALLGEFSQGPGLLVPPGLHTVRFQWSLRVAEAGPDGLQFNLEAPAAPVAVMDLDLPCDWEVIALSGTTFVAHLRGAAIRQRWRTSFGGQRQVAFATRLAANAGKRHFVRTRQHAEFEVTPAGVEAEFQLELDSLHGKLAEVSLDCPLSFEPRELVLRQALSWTTMVRNGRQRLQASLPTPLEGRATLTVRGRLPAEIGGRLHFPLLVLNNGLVGRETIRVRTSPDLSLGEWTFSRFRANEIEAQDAEGFEVLSLQRVDGGVAPAEAPSARLRPSRPGMAVAQDSWWHIGVSESSLVTRLTWEVREGAVGRLSLQLPAGWRLGNLKEDVQFREPGRLQRATVEEGVFPRLHLDLSAALEPERPLQATLRLHGGGPDLAAPRTWLPAPEFGMPEARLLRSRLAVTFDAGLDCSEHTLRVPSSEAPEGKDLPWSGRIPDRYFAAVGQALRGSLHLHREPVRLRAQSTMDVTLLEDRRLVRYGLRLQPLSGAPSQVRLRFSVPPPSLSWTVSAGRNEVLGTLEPLRPESLPAGTTAGPDLWQLTLARPLTEPILLRAEGRLPDRRERDLDVPLVLVADARVQEGVLLVRFPASQAARFEAAGMESIEPPAGPGDDSMPVWRAFRYGPDSLRFRLLDVSSQLTPGRPIVNLLRVDRQVDSAARVFTRYVFRIQASAAQTAKVALPAGAELLGVWKEGAWVEASWSGSGQLQVACGANPTHYEIRFAQAGSSGVFLKRMPNALPRWESQAVVLEGTRFWHLPPFWTPLSPSGFELAAGSLAQPDALARPGRLPGGVARRDLLSDAYERWAQRSGDDRSVALSALLRHLEAELGRQGLALVLDRDAIRRAGVTLSAPLPKASAADPWESLGLAVLPVESAFLLTSAQQASKWIERLDDLEKRLTPVLAEAWTQGHDRTGRFCILSEAGDLEVTGGSRGGASRSQELVEPAENVWMAPEAAEDAELICVSSVHCHALGLATGLLLLLCALRFSPSMGWFGGTWLVLGVLLLFWVPGNLAAAAVWPVLAACASMGVAFLRRRALAGAAPRGPALALPVALFLLLLPPLGAQEPAGERVLVYVVPGSADPAKDETVLVPRGWWTRLQRWDQDLPPDYPDFVFVQGDYAGSLDARRIRLEAKYQLHLLRDGPVGVVVPIGPARLAGALLDGAPALATPVGGALGYRLQVSGKGPHSLVLQFESDVGQNEFSSSIPRISASGLALRPAAALREVQVLGILGEQRASGGAEAILEADLGRGAELRVRWRTAPAAKERIRVREEHHWELRPGEQSLHARLHYEPIAGEISNLRLALPPGLEVKGVEVRGLPGQLNPPALRDWRLIPNATDRSGIRQDSELDEDRNSGEFRYRVLQLLLRSPVTTSFQVHLDLVIRSSEPSSAIEWRQAEAVFRAFAAPVPLLDCRKLEHECHHSTSCELRFPAPLDAERLGGILSYRALGLHAEPALLRELTPLLPGSRLLLGDLGVLSGTTAFAFAGGAKPGVIVRVRPVELVRGASQDLALTITPEEAELSGVLNVLLGGAEQGLLEYRTSPALQVAQVTGERLERWEQRGDRLQLWLGKSSTKERKLVLTGRVRYPREAAGAGTLTLPWIRLLGAPGPTPTHLRVSRRGGVNLHGERLRGLQEVVGPPPDPETVVEWTAPQADYAGVLRVTARQPLLEARCLVRLSAPVRRRVSFVLEIDCQASGIDEQVVRFILKNWFGEDLRAEGEGVRDFRREFRSDRELECRTLLRPGPGNRLRFNVHGSLPLDAEHRAVVPSFAVAGLEQIERELAPLPEGLRAVTTLPAANQAGLVPWPHDGDQPLLVEAPRPAPQHVELGFVEYETHWLISEELLHLARYQVLHGAGEDWRLPWPASCRLVAVAVNGTPATCGQDEELRISLPARAGWSEVVVLWTQPTAALGQVVLAPPRAAKPTTLPIPWTIHAPAGSVAAVGSLRPGAAAALQRTLARAASFSLVTQRLIRRAEALGSDNVERQLLQAAERFYGLVDEADRRRTALPAADGEEVGRLLNDMKARYAGQFPGAPGPWERLRRRAEELARERVAGFPTARLVGGDQAGRPFYDFLSTNPTQAQAVLRLPVETRRREAFARTLILALTVLAVVFLTRTSWSRRAGMLERFWPEVFLVIGVGWWACFPAPWGGLALAAGAAAVRLALVGGLRARFVFDRAAPSA